jgi:hypothetical protein
MPKDQRQRAPLIDGAAVQMNGEQWVVPPLNLRLLRKFETAIAEINRDFQDPTKQIAVMAKLAEIAHAALQRNYPDVTLEQVEDMVDMGNAAIVLGTVLGVSGMVRKDAASGGDAAGPLTGTTSTAS